MYNLPNEKTNAKEVSPWTTGPGEILKHSLELINKDNDANRRLAMIAIDNAVELTIKTYLGLPKRITGITIPRKKYQEISENFPSLLDALEEYATDKIIGIDLGEIEWFHRLRNQLYHQGNGLTVEKEKVQMYATLANELFYKVFGIKLFEPQSDKGKLLSEFLEAWTFLETELHSMAFDNSLTGAPDKRGVNFYLKYLGEGGVIPDEEIISIRAFKEIRNKIVHEYIAYKDKLTPQVVKELQELVKKYKQE